MNLKILSLTSGFAFISSCQTFGSGSAKMALLDNPGPQTRSELTATISEALSGRTVNISPDSFTRSSRLIIEPLRFMDPSGVPVSDRNSPNIEHFYLQMSGSDCFLFHAQSETRHYLQHVRCRPEAPSGEKR